MTRLHIDRNSSRHVAETRRYFPEWADRPPRRRMQLESERNSYSAGGYAEEFGYRVQLDSPTIAPTLIGDPEGCRYWRVQVGALHPGYPECSKPLDREFARSWSGGDVVYRGVASGVQTGRHAGDSPANAMQVYPLVDFKIIRVSGHGRAPADHVGFGARLISLWKEFHILRREFRGFVE